MRGLVGTILTVDSTATVEEVSKCLNKATIVIFRDGMYIVADDEYIYYFGAIESSRVPSKLGVFLKEVGKYAAGKKYYTKDNSVFYRRSKHIEGDMYVRTT
jgi:hypothetical protein